MIEQKLETPNSHPEHGWRLSRNSPSLPEVFSSITVPKNAGFWRTLLAYVGPGLMVSVGYMDPGNWATDLAGGAQFGYLLLSVILISNLMAILLQHLALKLGIVTGRDLAQACRDHYSRPLSLLLWIMCEVAIAACDLAEVIGSAIALNLLFHIPLVVGVVITAADVLIVLFLQHRGFRYIEVLVGVIIFMIGGCFLYEILIAQPPIAAMLSGLIPSPQIVFNPSALYIAIGILGATVMPHNLYLHSSIVQTRAFEQDEPGKRSAIKFATIDSTLALFLAFFVNAAILVTAAAAFHGKGHDSVADISDAHKLLTPVLGAGSAGSSSSTLRAPWAGPSDAVRRLTDCSTRLLSSVEPTAKALAGLPSTAMSARPYGASASSRREFGAITPIRRNREGASGAASVAMAIRGAAPNNRVRSPRIGAAVLTATA